MEFIDLNGKVKEAESFFVIDHEGEQFVETKVIGKNSNWIEWQPLSDFQEKNPMIMLMMKPENIGE
jgi:hypothetical protein